MTNSSISRALLSVSDKSGLKTLATALVEHSITLLSTGGTANAIRTFGFAVTDISEVTGFPEIMDGRVKTLHPKVHGGLLACLDNKEHTQAMQTHAIEPIGLVIVNLYPFEATVARGAPAAEIIENIDIGGPSMIRSAAKNHAFTTVITDPADYPALMEELRIHQGKTSLAFRQRMAAKAFALTASYDSAISHWFALQQQDLFPERITFALSRKQSLRYGENPHQSAAFYQFNPPVGLAAASQIQGKELSYNNINDADAALQIAHSFQRPTAVIVKHANPCGVAWGDSITEAFDRALTSDPVSAFGGILAFNKPITLTLAEKISTLFVEAVIAPGIEDNAKTLLANKKNMRILLTPTADKDHSHNPMVRSVSGGLLVQENDNNEITEHDLEIVTTTHPSATQISDMLFAFHVCKYVKSNAIVLVKDKATIGIGAGQMSRVDAVRIATMKAADSPTDPKRAQGSILASDAFFPFADGLLQAAAAGVKAVIQPGGSVRDEEVIQAANAHGIAMAFTGVRHFRH